MSSTITATTAMEQPSSSTPDDIHLWTAPQESALLQSVIRWKPVGMHKHFRMIAIRDNLLASGLVNPEDTHTSTSGIWRKLNSLYDLKALDEREDSIIYDGSGVSESGGGGGGEERGQSETRSMSSSKETQGATSEKLYWREFELPRDEFEELMWQRRLAPDGSVMESSPPTVVGVGGRRGSTVADSDELRSSPVSVSGRTGSGRGRGRGRRGGRLSRLQNELETESGKGSRRTSKAASVVEQEDEAMEDVDEEGDEGSGSDEDEESDESAEEEAETKRGAGSKRGRGGGRGRGRRGRRR